MPANQRRNHIYYIDTSVSLDNRPLVKFIRNHLRDSSGVFSISSLVKISMLSVISTLSLKLYLNSLVYDRNIFGSSAKIFGNFRKMFGNVRATLGQILENLRKVVGNLWKIVNYAVILRKKKDGDWYIYPYFLGCENLNNAHKNAQKRYKIFKPRLLNLLSTGTNIANNLAFFVPFRLC